MLRKPKAKSLSRTCKAVVAL